MALTPPAVLEAHPHLDRRVIGAPRKQKAPVVA
jgi:hypothetical protein